MGAGDTTTARARIVSARDGLLCDLNASLCSEAASLDYATHVIKSVTP